MNDTPKYLTTGQVAKMLSLSSRKIQDLANHKELKSFRINPGPGGHRRFAVEDVEAFAAKHNIPIRPLTSRR